MILPNSPFLRSLVLLCALVFAPASLAVVTLMDPGGTAVPNQTVTITLPGMEPKEAESDDDGILFWLDGDGNRGEEIDELPVGALISGGYGFSNVEVTDGEGLSTTSKVLLGAAT